MPSPQAVTCQIRYTLDLAELDAFETYARTWISLIKRYGGIHHRQPVVKLVVGTFSCSH
jgi:hypothetical protein